MTMAQSNSMGAKKRFYFFWCHSLWMCAFCSFCLPLCVSLLPFCSSSHSSFFFLLLFFSSSLLSRVFFALPHLFVFFCPFYLLALLSPLLFFHDLSVFPAFSVIRLPMSEWILALYLHPLPIIVSLDFFFLSPTTASVPPYMCVPLCICMILEVWDSWTSLNFKASDDGGNIKVKW